MLRIRLFRTGKKNRPFFRIVVTDKRNPPKAGRFLEILGFYDPLTKEKGFKKERVEHWLSVGAKASDSVHNLLIKEGILKGEKIPVHKKSKKEAAPQEQAEAKEETKVAEPTKEIKETEVTSETKEAETAEGAEEKKEAELTKETEKTEKPGEEK